MIDTKRRIKEHEGFSPTVYADSLGYKTVGYGHLVTIKDDFVMGEIYSPEQLDGVFNEDYSIAEKDGKDIIRDEITIEVWETYSDKQKEIVESVLIEMCFNLGKPRVLKFKNFLQGLKDKDFNKAADEMLDSRWAVQVKSRALILSNMIRGL
tara:strand:+ start:352 stop:807 length:456 start_codon:yes stop_codon:yes gene_type:complete